MEPRFGRDFSQVRVHTDARAGASAQAVRALAYTVGTHIVFRRGYYQPLTTGGRRLIAHELTHTIQQSDQGARPLGEASFEVGEPKGVLEQEADEVASDVVSQRDPAETSLQFEYPLASDLQTLKGPHTASGAGQEVGRGVVKVDSRVSAQIQGQPGGLDPISLYCAILAAICLGTLVAPEFLLPEAACVLFVETCSAGQA
jgi:hypothetical protein